MNSLDAYKFCQLCAGSLSRKGDALVCDACGFTFFNNPAPCSVAVIRNTSGKYLLTKRGINPGKGKLDLPGGFIETGETAEAALRREMREELAIAVDNVQYQGTYTGDYEFQGVSKPVLVIVFLIVLDDDVTPKAGDDAVSYDFYDADAVSFDDIHFECDRRALRDAIAKDAR